MPRNGTKRLNTSHVVWCSEDPQFEADTPEVQLNLLYSAYPGKLPVQWRGVAWRYGDFNTEELK